MTLASLLAVFRPDVAFESYQELLLAAFQARGNSAAKNSPESVFGPLAPSLELLGEGEGYKVRLHIHLSETHPQLLIEIGEEKETRFIVAAKAYLSRFDQAQIRSGHLVSSGLSHEEIHRIMARGLYIIGANEDVITRYGKEWSAHEEMVFLDDKKNFWSEIAKRGLLTGIPVGESGETNCTQKLYD